MTNPRPEEPVIARAVLLRQRLAQGADRLEGLATDLLEEVRLLRQEVARTDPEGEHDDHRQHPGA